MWKPPPAAGTPRTPGTSVRPSAWRRNARSTASIQSRSDSSSNTSVRDRNMSSWLIYPSFSQGVAPRIRRSCLAGGTRIEPFEERQPMLEYLMVVRIRGKEPSDHEIDSSCLVARKLAVPQISLVDDLGEAGEAAIPKPGPLEESLEGAVLSHVAEFGPGRVEGNRSRRKFFWIGKEEGRFRIDESLDEPRRGQAVDVGPPARDPLPASELAKIPRSLLSSPRLFRRSGTHGDSLPQPLDLSPRRGVEEVELAELLVLPLELGQIRLDPFAGGCGLAVEILQ